MGSGSGISFGPGLAEYTVTLQTELCLDLFGGLAGGEFGGAGFADAAPAPDDLDHLPQTVGDDESHAYCDEVEKHDGRLLRPDGVWVGWGTCRLSMQDSRVLAVEDLLCGRDQEAGVGFDGKASFDEAVDGQLMRGLHFLRYLEERLMMDASDLRVGQVGGDIRKMIVQVPKSAVSYFWGELGCVIWTGEDSLSR